MKRITIIAFAILYAHHCFGQDSTKIGHTFYVKTEVLNSLKTLIEPKSYDLDIQVSYRVINALHVVATYGKTTYYLSGTLESNITPGKFQSSELIGNSKNRASLMARWYPSSDGDDILDYLFVEGGFFFQEYVGTTNLTIYQDDKTNVIAQNRRELVFNRLGPQLNLGLSKRFSRNNDNRKISFTPEFYIGFYYNHLQIIQDNVVNIIGPPEPFESYSESKFRLSIRAKIGIGLF